MGQGVPSATALCCSLFRVRLRLLLETSGIRKWFFLAARSQATSILTKPFLGSLQGVSTPKTASTYPAESEPLRTSSLKVI